MSDLFGESETKFEDLPETKVEIKAKPIDLPEIEVDQVAVEEQNKELYNVTGTRIDDFCTAHGIDPKIAFNLNTGPSLGWSNLSPIQEKTLPDLLTKTANMIVQSQSGTGKTGCFALAMLKAIDLSIPAPQVICIAPTLELAQQIHSVLDGMVVASDYAESLLLLIKGTKAWDSIPQQIIVGTPGKIADRINRGALLLNNVKLFVLDEADLLLQEEKEQNRRPQPPAFSGEAGMGAAGENTMAGEAVFGMEKPPQTSMSQDVINIKNAIDQQLAAANAPPVRVLLFSATYEAEGDIAQEDKDDLEKQKSVFNNFAKKIIPNQENLIVHTIPREKQTLKNMAQYWIDAGTFQLKKDVVKDLLANQIPGQTIIFVNKREQAGILREYLAFEGFEGIEILHGEMLPEDRKAVMQRFKAQQFKILITTNVSSRGLDISNVTHVINYDLPTAKIVDPNTNMPRWFIEPATYLHRTGRTARFGKKGTAINILGRNNEKAMLEELENYFKIKIKEIKREDVEQNKFHEE